MPSKRTIELLPSLSLIDIGARGGLHARWRSCAAPVNAIGFDADPDECARLNSLHRGVHFLPYALGSRDGAQATLHVTRSPGSSSLYAPNDAVVGAFPFGKSMEVERRIPVTVSTLDRVSDREGFAADVIKMDVQGAELDILRGAERVLSTTLLLETEVEFQELYEAQPLFVDVDQHMRERGWLLLGLRRSFWRRHTSPVADGGTLVHGDALYLNERLLRDARPESLLKAAAALAVYRQMDYVALLGERLGDADLARRLCPPSPRWAALLGSFMHRVGSHRQWRAWLDRCCPPGVTDWHDPDEFF